MATVDHLDDDALLAFVQGKVAPAEAAAVNSHIDDCAECRRVLAETARYYLEHSLHTTAADVRPARAPAHPDTARYVVLGVLGTGASGVVYAAFDTKLDRKVALKLLRAAAGTETAQSERLLREAQALARLAHPNVIAVHDVGTLDGRVFIAMEFVDGTTLTRWLRERARSWREIVAVFKGLAHGLAAAHAAGIVHRDFKPDNVLVGSDDRPRIVDFGLAAALGASPMTGDLVGTPAYMAPEQLRGEASGAASDQFSLCAALYEALYGESPFGGDTLTERIAEVTAGRVRPAPKASAIPAWLRARVVRGLNVAAADRYPSMTALVAALDHDPSRARRRWLAVAGATAVAIGAVVVYRAAMPSPNASCSGADHEVADAWAAHRPAIAAAFAATAKPYAADQLATVDTLIDAYTSGWARMRTDACEATRVRGEQSDELLDLRMACLDARLQQVAALADAFAHADAAVVQNAVHAVQALPPIDDCANATALRAPTPPPADLATRARVDALHATLTKLRVQRDVGRYRDVAQQLVAAIAEARAVHYRPIEAEALALDGLVRADLDDAPGAEQAFRGALAAAEAGRRADLVIAALTGLTFVVGYGQARDAEGEALSQQALAVIEGTGGSDLLSAHVLYDRGSLRFREGKYAESIDDHRAALALLEHALGPDHLDVANAHNNLGAPLEAQGKYADALVEFQRAQHIYETKLGPNHPDVAMAENNVAATQRDLGNFRAAVQLFERVLATKEKLYGPDAPSVAATLSNLGAALDDLSEYDRAVAVLERAIAIRERTQGKDSLDVTEPISGLGNVLFDMGRGNEAVDQYARVLAIQRAKLAPDHPKVIETIIDLAEGRRVAGHAAAALDDYRQALALTEHAPALQRYVPYALTGIGDSELDLGAAAKATEPLTRALAFREALPADDIDLARTRFALARALALSGGNQARARELAEAARSGYTADRPAARAGRAQIEAWLAGGKR